MVRPAHRVARRRLTAAGRVAGLVGAYLALVQLPLMARLPWLERAVGLDRPAAWHRGRGTNVVLVLVAHVLLVTAGSRRASTLRRPRIGPHAAIATAASGRRPCESDDLRDRSENPTSGGPP